MATIRRLHCERTDHHDDPQSVRQSPVCMTGEGKAPPMWRGEVAQRLSRR